MAGYISPTQDLLFAMDVASGLFEPRPGNDFAGDGGRALAGSVLEAAGRLATDVLAPLHRTADLQGSRLENGRVRFPSGFRDAYAAYRDGGWSGLPHPEALGGQGLPFPLTMAASELWGAANCTFGLLLMPIGGAIRLLQQFGTETQQARYLPRLVSGEWTATMAMTEPQAGSDLGAIRCRATPDGTQYRIFGQKSYVSFADHDMTDNVLHFLLARTPDAPPGVRGLTLFLVPTVLHTDGGRHVRNDVRYLSLEHKLGLNGMPTGTLSYGDEEGAVAYRVGEECRGIQCMFALLNRARLNVGLMGLAGAERAYQPALRYARERVQGRLAGGATGEAVTIHRHADVRRMLLSMKARIDAMRLLAFYAAGLVEDTESGVDPERRRSSQARLDLLTPVIKAWLTETGFQVVSTGIQVHGGLGYMEESGLPQLLREARVHPLFEGTTGIQAADLVGRKIAADGGAVLETLLNDLTGVAPALARSADPELRRIGALLDDASLALRRATAWLAETAAADPQRALAVSVPYLDMLATVAGGWLLGRAAAGAEQPGAERVYGQDFLAARKAIACFFVDHQVAMVPGRVHAVTKGAGSVVGPGVDLL